MRTLVALVLVSSSAQAALVNSQPAGPGWLKLNLPVPNPAYHSWSGWPTGNTAALVTALNPGAAALWTDGPTVQLWTPIFGSDIHRHDLTPEFAAGLAEVSLTKGVRRTVLPTVSMGLYLYEDRWTYAGAGGYSRTEWLPAFFIPEPSGLALACVICSLGARRAPRK